MHSHPKSSSDLSLNYTDRLYLALLGMLTSMGSTSWAITTSCAFLFSTRVVTVLTPEKQVRNVCFRSVFCQGFHISFIQPAVSIAHHCENCEHFHILSVTQRSCSLDNLLKLRVKKLVYFALHFEFRWRNSHIIAIACPILYGCSRRHPYSHICE